MLSLLCPYLSTDTWHFIFLHATSLVLALQALQWSPIQHSHSLYWHSQNLYWHFSFASAPLYTVHTLLLTFSEPLQALGLYNNLKKPIIDTLEAFFPCLCWPTLLLYLNKHYLNTSTHFTASTTLTQPLLARSGLLQALSHDLHEHCQGLYWPSHRHIHGHGHLATTAYNGILRASTDYNPSHSLYEHPLLS